MGAGNFCMDRNCEAAVTYSGSWSWLREVQRVQGIYVWIGILTEDESNCMRNLCYARILYSDETWWLIEMSRIFRCGQRGLG